MQHPADEVILCWDFGVSPGVEEELQIPHGAAQHSKRDIGQQHWFGDGEITAYRNIGFYRQTDKAVSQID